MVLTLRCYNDNDNDKSLFALRPPAHATVNFMYGLFNGGMDVAKIVYIYNILCRGSSCVHQFIYFNDFLCLSRGYFNQRLNI